MHVTYGCKQNKQVQFGTTAWIEWWTTYVGYTHNIFVKLAYGDMHYRLFCLSVNVGKKAL
jgi:hypothetical protein